MRGGQAWEEKAGGEGFGWKKRRRWRPRGLEVVVVEEEVIFVDNHAPIVTCTFTYTQGHVPDDTEANLTVLAPTQKSNKQSHAAEFLHHSFGC
ncbi:hypothetical protein EYF80_027615 [Liparis tanakae]|uniref:Uncharacterized protein n=1 Tax=Liparis tanakae TaxID=230148 RepID=A0A4Z2HA30_9TELE|nr:hypothetical protein EYF80_027615 [Liparis tanakae]